MKNLFSIRRVVAAAAAALLLLMGHGARAVGYVWTNAAAALPAGMGSWENATNWSPNGVPSTNDMASLTGVNVIFSANIYVAGINLTNSLLTPQNAATNAIYLYGPFNAFNNPNLQGYVIQTALVGVSNAVLNGSLAYSNSTGSLAGTMTNVDTFQFVGPNTCVLGDPGIFVNQGLVQETGSGGLDFYTCAGSGPTAFYNQAGATYQFLTDSFISQEHCIVDSVFFQNEGLLWKSGGTNTTSILVPFNNLGGTIQVDSGTLVLGIASSYTANGNGSSSNGNFIMAAGAALDLTGGSSPTWAGQMTGSGAGAVLLSSGSLTANNVTLDFPSNVFQWSGGSLAGTMTNVDTLELVGTNPCVLGNPAIFVNQGLVQETGSGGLDFYTCNEGIEAFYNQVGATYQFLTDSFISQEHCINDNVFFQNEGLLWKSGGTNTTSILVPFNNRGGTIQVDSGTLVLGIASGYTDNGYGSSSNGTLVVAAGAALDLTGGSNPTWAGEMTGSGGGTVLLGSGTLDGSPSVTLDFPSNMLQWNGGTLAGAITNIAMVQLVGTNISFLGNDAIFVNQGWVQETGSGGLQFLTCGGVGPTAVYNQPGATFQLTTDSSISWSHCVGVSAFFQNEGLFWKSGGTNVTTISLPFNNLGGIIKVDSGTLVLTVSDSRLGEGSSSNGTFMVAAGATLDVTGGSSPIWAGQMNGSGAGTVLLTSGTLQGSSATINFPPKMFQWGNATVAGAITNIGTIEMVGTNANVLANDAIFVNQGLVQETGSGGLQFLTCGGIGPTAFYNLAGGTFQLMTDCSISQSHCSGVSVFFENQGLLWKSGGTNTTTISVPFMNLNGSIEVDSGTLALNSTVNGTSSYSQGSGFFTVQLGGTNTGQSGQLSVAGPVALGGPLNVKVAPGFAPAIGSHFQIISCGSRSGTFSPLNLPAGIAVAYTNTSVSLVVTGMVAIQILSPQISGANFDFSFATASNQNYTIQQNTNLNTGNWTFVTNITGTGSLYQFITPVTNIPALFFRVIEP